MAAHRRPRVTGLQPVSTCSASGFQPLAAWRPGDHRPAIIGRHSHNIGRTIPKTGHDLPYLGEPFPNIGQAMPHLGESFPNIGRASPYLGEPFPNIERASPYLGETFPNIEQPTPCLGEPLPNIGQPAPHFGDALHRIDPFITHQFTHGATIRCQSKHSPNVWRSGNG